MEAKPEQKPTEVPSETRESDFDHEFSVSLFDYCIDQYQKGQLTYAEAIAAYTEAMTDHLELGDE